MIFFSFSQNIELKTPLHVAVLNQHPGIINLLLCHPAIEVSLMERDKAGLTPFATALTCRNDKAALAILKKLPTAAEQVRNSFNLASYDSTGSYCVKLCRHVQTLHQTYVTVLSLSS